MDVMADDQDKGIIVLFWSNFVISPRPKPVKNHGPHVLCDFFNLLILTSAKQSTIFQTR